MKKRFLLMLSACVLFGAMNTGMAEEFFTEEESQTSTDEGDLFGEESFFTEEEIDVSGDIPEADEMEESLSRSILSFGTDDTDQESEDGGINDAYLLNDSGAVWTVKPYLTARVKGMGEYETPDYGNIFLEWYIPDEAEWEDAQDPDNPTAPAAKDGNTAKKAVDKEISTDKKNKKTSTIEFYIYAVDKSGVGQQIAHQAGAVGKYCGQENAYGGNYKVKNVSAGEYTYMVRAEKQTVVDSSKKTYSESYGKRATVTFEMTDEYDASWKTVSVSAAITKDNENGRVVTVTWKADPYIMARLADLKADGSYKDVAGKGWQFKKDVTVEKKSGKKTVKSEVSTLFEGYEIAETTGNLKKRKVTSTTKNKKTTYSTSYSDVSQEWYLNHLEYDETTGMFTLTIRFDDEDLKKSSKESTDACIISDSKSLAFKVTPVHTTNNSKNVVVRGNAATSNTIQLLSSSNNWKKIQKVSGEQYKDSEENIDDKLVTLSITVVNDFTFTNDPEGTYPRTVDNCVYYSVTGFIKPSNSKATTASIRLSEDDEGALQVSCGSSCIYTDDAGQKHLTITDNENGTSTITVTGYVPDQASVDFVVTPSRQKKVDTKSKSKVTSKTTTTNGTAYKKTVKLSSKWQTKPVIDSAVQSGDKQVTLRFRAGGALVDGEEFIVTGFADKLTFKYNEIQDADSNDVITKSLKCTTSSSSMKNTKLSESAVYENDGSVVFEVTATVKKDGTYNFTVQPKNGSVTGATSSKKTVKVVAASSGAVVDMSFGYVKTADDGETKTMRVSWKCLRTDVKNFIVLFEGKAPQTVEYVKNTKEYYVDYTGISADEDYTCYIETYTKKGERLLDKATAFANQVVAVSVDDASEVTEVLLPAENIKTATVNGENALIAGEQVKITAKAVGGDGNYTYTLIHKDAAGNDVQVENTSGSFTVALDWKPVSETDGEGNVTYYDTVTYPYTIKVTCKNAAYNDGTAVETSTDFEIANVPTTFTIGAFTYRVLNISNHRAAVVSYNPAKVGKNDNPKKPTVPIKVTRGSKTTTNYNVKEIGPGAFAETDESSVRITSVKLPNKIEVISENAFAGCTSLSSMSCYDK